MRIKFSCAVGGMIKITMEDTVREWAELYLRGMLGNTVTGMVKIAFIRGYNYGFG